MIVVSFYFLAGLRKGFEDGGGDDEFEEGTEEQGEGSQAEAHVVLVGGEGDGSEGLTSEFYAGQLDENGHDEDDDEEGVVAEVREDIEFGFFEFSGVDFVEDLHQDECVEEDAVVFSGLVGPFFGSNGRLDVEEFRA